MLTRRDARLFSARFLSPVRLLYSDTALLLAAPKSALEVKKYKCDKSDQICGDFQNLFHERTKPYVCGKVTCVIGGYQLYIHAALNPAELGDHRQRRTGQYEVVQKRIFVSCRIESIR